MPRFVVRAAGPAFVLAVTVATWWLFGDQSEPRGDYGPALRVPVLPHPVEVLVGVIAAAVAGWRRRRLSSARCGTATWTAAG